MTTSAKLIKSEKGRIGAAGILLLGMAACATVPPPNEQLAVSKAAVTSATRSGATDLAPLEIKSANEKMTAADKAMTDKKYEDARRLAEEAQVDAQLAETKTNLAKAQKAVNDSQESIRVMQEEIQRMNQQ